MLTMGHGDNVNTVHMGLTKGGGGGSKKLSPIVLDNIMKIPSVKMDTCVNHSSCE